MFSLTIKRKDIEKALTLSNKIHAPSSSASRSNTRGVALVVAPVPGSDDCDVRLICSDVTHARALAVVVPEGATVNRAPVDMVILDMNSVSLARAIGRGEMVTLRYEDEALRCDDTHCQIVYGTSEIDKVLAVPTEVVAWASVDANEVRRGILDMIHEGNALNAAVVSMEIDHIIIRIRSSIAWNVVSIGGGVDYPFSDDKASKSQGVIAVGPLAALATLIDYGVEQRVEVSLMGEPVHFLRLRYGNVTIFASFKKGLG